MYKNNAIDWASGCRHDENIISLCLMLIFRSDYTQTGLTRKPQQGRRKEYHKKFLNVGALKGSCIYNSKVQWNQEIELKF